MQHTRWELAHLPTLARLASRPQVLLAFFPASCQRSKTSHMTSHQGRIKHKTRLMGQHIIHEIIHRERTHPPRYR
jgi:hypothetical protein